MKKFHKFFVLFFIFSIMFLNQPIILQTKAEIIENDNIIYFVYDSENNKITETNYVEIGDKIITKAFKQYEVYKIDKNSHSAYVTLSGNYIKPKIKESESNPKSSKNFTKKVGIYLTHNDESYLLGDEAASGSKKGGIHDIATSLANSFEALNYTVFLDETLHLPHDINAFSRSRETASLLINNNVDAIFDIHRDGVSRSIYVESVDGIERCKIRIVIGQENENFENNLKFAMYLLSVAENYYPWLFLDIYCTKGNYNQDLTNKSLLFEMGTYLAEKDLVLGSVPLLAEVIDKTLFSTISSDNTLEINKAVNENDENLINNVLNQNVSTSNFQNRYVINVIVFASLFVVIMGTIIIISLDYNKKRKKKN